MTKQEFLSGLEERLLEEGADVLVPENLSYYSSYIEEEKSKGRTEEDVLEELGNPALIARSILEAAGYEVDGIPDEQPGSFDNARTSDEEPDEQERPGDGGSFSGSFRTFENRYLPLIGLVCAVLVIFLVLAGVIALLSPFVIGVIVFALIMRLFGGSGW